MLRPTCLKEIIVTNVVINKLWRGNMAVSEELQVMIYNLENSKLKELLLFVEDELRLSEQAINEGFEVRK